MFAKYFKYNLVLLAIVFSCSLNFANSSIGEFDVQKLASNVANILIENFVYTGLRNNDEKAKETYMQLQDIVNNDATMKKLHIEFEESTKKYYEDTKNYKFVMDDNWSQKYLPNVFEFITKLYENLEKIDKQELARKYKFNRSEKRNVDQCYFPGFFCCAECLMKLHLGFNYKALNN